MLTRSARRLCSRQIHLLTINSMAKGKQYCKESSFAVALGTGAQQLGPPVYVPSQGVATVTTLPYRRRTLLERSLLSRSSLAHTNHQIVKMSFNRVSGSRGKIDRYLGNHDEEDNYLNDLARYFNLGYVHYVS